jgi:hypothetical protein
VSGVIVSVLIRELDKVLVITYVLIEVLVSFILNRILDKEVVMVLIVGGFEEVVVFIVVMLLEVSLVEDGLKVVFLVDVEVVVYQLIVVEVV